jgi:hypothetical protein
MSNRCCANLPTSGQARKGHRGRVKVDSARPMESLARYNPFMTTLLAMSTGVMVAIIIGASVPIVLVVVGLIQKNKKTP